MGLLHHRINAYVFLLEIAKFLSIEVEPVYLVISNNESRSFTSPSPIDCVVKLWIYANLTSEKSYFISGQGWTSLHILVLMPLFTFHCLITQNNSSSTLSIILERVHILELLTSTNTFFFFEGSYNSWYRKMPSMGSRNQLLSQWRWCC